jgi:arabinogalactan endo-1,4-beta-galactosidase
MWQVWNEPNINVFWPRRPFQPTYVKLLRAAHNAIKAADPGAKVVLAGLPNYSWVQISKLYKAGARDLFDVAAVHPYTKYPQGVITIIQKVRQVMNAAGDSNKTIIADEVSWPSSVGKTDHNVGYDFATTEAGQARNLATLLPLLGQYRKSLGIGGFYYYTWAADEQPNTLAFDFAGLERFSLTDETFTPKPALSAFSHAALALEHCARKGSVATSCAQR